MAKRSRWQAEAGVVVVLGLIAGILIWSKLRLATDVPRSAYAVPEARATQGGGVYHGPHYGAVPELTDEDEAAQGVPSENEDAVDEDGEAHEASASDASDASDEP